MLLALFGALFAALFLLNNLAKTLTKAEKIGFVDLLLAFLASLLFVISATMGEMSGQADPFGTALMRNVGGGLAIFSLLLIVVEIRRPQRLRGSRGLLGFGVGLLIVASSFIVPLSARQFALATPTPIQFADARTASGSDAPAAASLPPTATRPPTQTTAPRPSATPTLTRTPLPSPTATSTRWSYASQTAAPSPTLPTPCLATVDFNLRLRVQPNHDAETLTIIPFSTTVTVFGRNADSTWWYVQHQGQVGWVDGEFITRSISCDDLPVQPES